VEHVSAKLDISERRACRVLGQHLCRAVTNQANGAAAWC
jgi:hypothetical protein